MTEFKTGGYYPTCLHGKDNCTCFKNSFNLMIMDERLKDVDLINEVNNTMKDVKFQLFIDEKRWYNTWKERGLVYNGQAQETRFQLKMKEYFTDWMENGNDMPWDKIIGEAHICKVREKKLR